MSWLGVVPARYDERVELDGSRRGERAVDGDLAPPGLQDAADRGDHQCGDTEALGRLDQCGDSGEVGAGVGDDDLARGRRGLKRRGTGPVKCGQNGYSPTVRRARRVSRLEEKLMYVVEATEILARSTTLTSVGWVGYIIIGALAGWIAGMIMKTKEGLVLDIVIGVVGALIGGFLLSFVVDTASGGWWFTLFTAVLGAVILLGLLRMVRRT